MTTNQSLDIARRDVLKTVGLGIGLGAVGTTWLSHPARAAAGGASEVLYLVDNSNPRGGSPSKLYSVALVDSPTPVAELTLLGQLTDAGAGITYVSSHIACTPDGATIYAVNEGAAFGPGIRLGAWDVDSGTFSDIGPIAGVPSTARLTQAAISPAGKLYLIDVVNDVLYEILDYATTPTASPGLTVSVGLEGGDLVFDNTGTLYCYSLSPQKLLVIDPATGDVTAQIGSGLQSFTGLAIRDAGAGLLVGSRNKSSSPNPNSVIELDPSDGSVDTVYAMQLGGAPFAHTFGDMSVGPLAPDCLECTSEELLAKYEFGCVETAIVDDEEICVASDFQLERGTEDRISYTAGSFAADGDGEPITASFETDLCLWAVVKSGQQFSVQELTPVDGTVTVENTDPYAISFVAFFCTEAAATDFVAAFPSRGRGGRR